MTTNLTAATSGSSTVRAALVIQRQSNDPNDNPAGRSSTYADPSVPQAGRVTTGGVPPAGRGKQYAPFLRSAQNMTLTASSLSGYYLGIFQPPTTKQGDLVLVILRGAIGSLTGFTTLYAQNNLFIAYRWADVSNNNTAITLNVAYGTAAQVRVYGNAGKPTLAGAAVGTTFSSPVAAVTGNSVATRVYSGYYGGTVYSIAGWTYSKPVTGQNTQLTNYGYVLGATDSLIGADTVLPSSTATPTGVSANGNPTATTTNALVLIGPSTEFLYADVGLQEATGPDQSLQDTALVHLLSTDTHSSPGIFGYSHHPLLGTGTQRTYERWIRLRFSPGYGTAYHFRIWTPGNSVSTGWNISYGTTTTYAAPVNTASSVAINPLPTTDPGRDAPNLGAFSVNGTETQYTAWIVLQATVDTTVASPGPAIGFDAAGALIPVELRFAWTET